MTNKTHAELLRCPCCSNNAELASVIEDSYFAGCSKCSLRTKSLADKEEVIAAWNTRVNKEAEFLEDLMNFIDQKCAFDTIDRFGLGRQDAFLEIATKIEKFKKEQKAKDENTC
jgi:hypothetical protein